MKYAIVALLLLNIFASCKKESDVKPESGLNFSDSDQFRGNVNGEYLNFIAGQDEFYKSGGTEGNNNGDSITFIGGLGRIDDDAGTFQIFTRYLPFNNRIVTDSAFKTLFTPGTYPISPNGLWILVQNHPVDWWSTSGDQTGSSFKILQEEPISWHGDYGIRIIASFNCRLYEPGKTALLVNGSCLLTFINYFQQK